MGTPDRTVGRERAAIDCQNAAVVIRDAAAGGVVHDIDDRAVAPDAAVAGDGLVANERAVLHDERRNLTGVALAMDGAAVGLTECGPAGVPGEHAAAGADRPVADEGAADDRGRRVPITVPDGAALGVNARGPADGLVADKDGIGGPQFAVLIGDAAAA